MEEIRERRELTGYKKIIGDLYKDFYYLLYDLEENKEACRDPQIYKLLLQNLFDVYKKEYQLIYLDYQLYYKREEFKKKELLASLTPHAWSFLCFHHENIPAKLIIEDVDIQSDKLFKEAERNNDTARPPYMEKLWLTHAEKKEAKRAEKEARKAAKRSAKALATTLQQSLKELERTHENTQEAPPETPQNAPESSSEENSGEETNDTEAKKQARLRALEERRKQNREEKRGEA